MSQDCQRLQDLLPLYAFEALEEAEALDVQQHIQRCETCRSEAADYRKLFWAMRIASAPKPTPEQVERVTAGVYRRIRRHQIAVFAFRAAAALAVAACLVVVLGRFWPGPHEAERRVELPPIAQGTVTHQSGVDAQQAAEPSLDELAVQTPEVPTGGDVASPTDSRSRVSPAPRLDGKPDGTGEGSQDSPHVRYRKKKRERELRAKNWQIVVELRKAFNRATSSPARLEDAAAYKRRLGEFEEILTQTQGAIQALDPVTKLHALELVHRLHAQLGNVREEEEAFGSCLAEYELQHGKHAADLKLAARANRSFLGGDFAKALSVYECLLERGPQRAIIAQIRKRLGEMLAAQGQIADSMAHLQWVIENAAGTRCAIDACKKAEEILTNVGDYARALKLLDRLENELALIPEDRKYAQLKRGVIHFMAKDHLLALRDFQHIVNKYPPGDYAVAQAKGYLNSIEASVLSRPIP